MRKVKITICTIIAMMGMTIMGTSTQACQEEKYQVEQATIERCLCSSIFALNITALTWCALPDACQWYMEQALQYIETDDPLPDGSRMPPPDATWYQIGIGAGMYTGLFGMYIASYHAIYKGIKALDQKYGICVASQRQHN